MEERCCADSLLCHIYLHSHGNRLFPDPIQPDGVDPRGLFPVFYHALQHTGSPCRSFTIPFAINGLRKKRFVYPRWLFLLHYTGTLCTPMTFVYLLLCYTVSAVCVMLIRYGYTIACYVIHDDVYFCLR